jgi:putative ABC transport system substrate-binding protein
MRRRNFIKGISSSAIAWPLVASRAQQAMPVIGFLSSISLEESGIAAFRLGLSEAGYLEGRNISIEYRRRR